MLSADTEKIGILAMAYHMPEGRKRLADVFRDEQVPFGTLAKNIDFVRDLGIDEVWVTEEMPSELALKAARKALKESGLDPSEIDVIIDFSSIPEDFPGPTWSAAGLIQEALGCHRAFATAVNCGGCASYHVALKSACALLASSDRFQTALLVAGDRTPRYNKVYYPITVASDGGGCLILKKGHGSRVVLGCEIRSIGRLHDVWYVPGLPNRKPLEPPTEKLLHMHCDLEKFNRGVIPVNFVMFRKVMQQLLTRLGKTFADVDYYIYPSFSTWDQAYFMKAFGVPPEKVYLENRKRHGHVQENDMLINYVDALEEGRIPSDATVMVVSNGAGFLWAAALVQS
jgi:3-oxoacyl-[acyl-carrier-protein] synthase-3